MPDTTFPNFSDLFDVVKDEAKAALSDAWGGLGDAAKDIIIHYMRQVATAIWDVIEGLNDDAYTPAAAAEMLAMSRRAAATAISGATELAYTEIQAAITRIYKAVADMVGAIVNGAISRVL